LQLRGRGARRLKPKIKSAQSIYKTARETPAQPIPAQSIPGEYRLPALADAPSKPVRATAPVDFAVEPTDVISFGSESGRGDQDIPIVAKSAARAAVFETQVPDGDRRARVGGAPDWPVNRGRAPAAQAVSEGGEDVAADHWPELPDWPFADPNDDAIAADVRAAEREELRRADSEQAGGAWNA
jgi:hypothetical protein